jgi:hypothetical protein
MSQREDLFIAYNASVDSRIANKTENESIWPADEAGCLKDLAAMVKSQSDLRDDGDGNIYLPFLDGVGQVIPEDMMPVFIRYKGAQLQGYTYDESTTPPRIYGFANMSSATIKITIL